MIELSYFEQRKNALQKEITLTERQLNNYPPGTLVCYKHRNSYKWFLQNLNDDGKRYRTYIPKSEQKFAEKMARKRFLTRKLSDMKNELNAIDKFLNIRKEGRPKYGLKDEECYRILLPEMYKWETNEYHKSEEYKEYLTVTGPKGEMMRSKSEAMIAQVLVSNSIPYRYECEQAFDNIIIYPDFTIMHPKTGRMYIWEHLGLIEKEKYQNIFAIKLKTYLNMGFIPDDNLIFTFETDNRPIDINYVQHLVNYYFCN